MELFPTCRWQGVSPLLNGGHESADAAVITAGPVRTGGLFTTFYQNYVDFHQNVLILINMCKFTLKCVNFHQN